MNTAELSLARWRKSSYSANNNACVEVAHLDDGRVAVRDSKDQGHGPALIFSPPEWNAFVRGMLDGEFSPTSAT